MLWSASDSEVTNQKADLIHLGKMNSKRWLVVVKRAASSGPLDMLNLQCVPSDAIKGGGRLQQRFFLKTSIIAQIA